MSYSTVKCSAAAALRGMVQICPVIYSSNLFINLISMRHHQRESNNQGFTVRVIMCWSHEIWCTAIMQISAGVSVVAAHLFLLQKISVLQCLYESSSKTDSEEKESRFLLTQRSLAEV